MAEEVTLVAEPRNTSGSASSGRLRRSGLLPAVIYGDGKEGTAIQLKEHELTQMLRHHAGSNLLVDLTVGTNAPKKVLLKEVQHHPVTGQLLHADFHAVSMTQKIKATLSVELKGTPEGVSQQGGVLEQMIREVEIECLPTDLVELFELDVTALRIGDHINVSDIQLDTSKVTMITSGDLAVAHVSAPRVEETPAEGEEGEEAAEGATEPEVIGEKKEETADGEDGGA